MKHIKFKFGSALLELMLLIAIVALLAAFALPARAQVYGVTTVAVTNLPTVVTTGGNSNTTSYVDVYSGQGLSLTLKFNVSSGTSNAWVYLYPSGDRTNYATTPWIATQNANGTNVVLLFTNWSAAQLSGVKSFLIGNLISTNAGTLTNKGAFFSRSGP
jgi:hypothetical protein